MASNLKDRFGNTFFFVFAFIPFLQWIPCFIMNGRVRTKRLIIMGFVNIAALMALIIVPSTVDGYIDSNHVPYPKAPAEADYWGKTYNDFKDWDAYDAARDEWLKSEGYKEYSKAMDAYHESEAYKAAQQHNMDLYNLRGNVSAVTGFASFALYLVYLVLIFFVERYKYLEALSNRSGAGAAREVTQTLKRERKNSTSRTSRTTRTTSNGKTTTTRTEEIIFHENREIADVVPDTVSSIVNVNTASEAEIEALPLINVVDAKKIIAYRNEHGSFKNLDEFFDSFTAKPHVIVKLQDKLTVDRPSKPQESETTNGTSKPRFDL